MVLTNFKVSIRLSNGDFSFEKQNSALHIPGSPYFSLQPYKDKYPNGTWEDWVQQAYLDRVSLSATGFYATPDIGYR